MEFEFSQFNCLLRQTNKNQYSSEGHNGIQNLYNMSSTMSRRNFKMIGYIRNRKCDHTEEKGQSMKTGPKTI